MAVKGFDVLSACTVRCECELVAHSAVIILRRPVIAWHVGCAVGLKRHKSNPEIGTFFDSDNCDVMPSVSIAWLVHDTANEGCVQNLNSAEQLPAQRAARPSWFVSASHFCHNLIIVLREVPLSSTGE